MTAPICRRGLTAGVIPGLLRKRTTVSYASAKPFDQIPGARPLPPIGTTWKYVKGGGSKNTFKIMDDQFKEFGPIFVEDFVRDVFINVCDPDEFQHIFEVDGRMPYKPPADVWVEYRKRRNYSLGIVNMNNEEWQRTRRALAPKLLRPREVYTNADNFNAVVVDMVNNLREKRDSKYQVADVQSELFKWSCESVATYVFDHRIGLFDKPPPEDAVRFIRAAGAHLKELGVLLFGFPLWKYFDTPAFKRFCKAQDTAIEIGGKYVNRKLESLKDGNELVTVKGDIEAVPLLTYLLAKNELNHNEVVISSIEVLFASIETTSTMMTWLLYNIAAHKDIQEELYKEVTSLSLPNGIAQPPDLQQMPLMKACMKESLRLFPVVPLNARKLQQDTVVCGYQVPKETLVVLNTFSAGRSEKYFDDPLKFRPERWLREKGESIHPFLNIPFGFGPRMCIGRRLAETEVCFLLTKLLHEYEMSYNEPMPVQPIQKTTLCPSTPLKLTFKDRI